MLVGHLVLGWQLLLQYKKVSYFCYIQSQAHDDYNLYQYFQISGFYLDIIPKKKTQK